METFQIRTDLALEARESVNEEESKLRGVSVDEHYEEETDIRITKVTIDTKNAENSNLDYLQAILPFPVVPQPLLLLPFA